MAKAVELVLQVSKTFVFHLDVKDYPHDGAFSAEMAFAQP